MITFGWHLLSPFIFLRLLDRLTIRESLSFLGLDRIDLRRLLIVLPVFCCGFALVSVPNMQFVWGPLGRFCNPFLDSTFPVGASSEAIQLVCTPFHR